MSSAPNTYAVMRWIDDGERLSVHNFKYVVEPQKPVESFNVGDTGLAKYVGYQGLWSFKILAIGGKRHMDSWLKEYITYGYRHSQDVLESNARDPPAPATPALTVPTYNVLLNDTCHVKLCDFGLARCMSQVTMNRSIGGLNLSNEICARAYRPPEILIGNHRMPTIKSP